MVTIPFWLVVLFFICLDIWAVSIEMRMSVMKTKLEVAEIIDKMLANELGRIKEEVEDGMVSSRTESGMCTRSDSECSTVNKQEME